MDLSQIKLKRLVIYVVAMTLLQVLVAFGWSFVWPQLATTGFIENAMLDPFVVAERPEFISEYEREVVGMLSWESLWVAAVGWVSALLWLIYGTWFVRVSGPEALSRYQIPFYLILGIAAVVSTYPFWESILQSSLLNTTALIGIMGFFHLFMFPLHAYALGALLFSPKIVRPLVPLASRVNL